MLMPPSSTTKHISPKSTCNLAIFCTARKRKQRTRGSYKTGKTEKHENERPVSLPLRYPSRATQLTFTCRLALALPATQSDTGNENDSHVEDGVQAATPSEQTSASTPFTMEYFEMRMAEERREREEAVGGLQSENFQLSERVRLLEKSNVKLEKANVELRQKVGELERQNERKHRVLGTQTKLLNVSGA
ncbi:hypothetical protein CPC08DRAFT_320865 [Agrocybe pediades]|nr:hypothetical protein CPC08DRAFT_320865 [Agrocybe pediades]